MPWLWPTRTEFNLCLAKKCLRYDLFLLLCKKLIKKSYLLLAFNQSLFRFCRHFISCSCAEQNYFETSGRRFLWCVCQNITKQIVSLEISFYQFFFVNITVHSVAAEGVMHIWWKILWCVRWVLLQTFNDFEMARIEIFFIDCHQSILGHCYF